MCRYLVLFAMLCGAGCQTTEKSSLNGSVAFNRSERLSVRLNMYLDSYDVEVKRSVLESWANVTNEQWQVVGTSKASGYPEKWRSSSVITTNLVGYTSGASVILDGEQVDVPLEPGVHLEVKVLPETQDIARVIGVFSQVTIVDQDLEEVLIPFDVICTLNEPKVVYQKVVVFDPTSDVDARE